jgi:hypothetical protein
MIFQSPETPEFISASHDVIPEFLRSLAFTQYLAMMTETYTANGSILLSLDSADGVCRVNANSSSIFKSAAVSTE